MCQGDDFEILLKSHLNVPNLIIHEQILMARKIREKYRLSGARGTHSPPATPQRLQNPKLPPGDPKQVDGLWLLATPNNFHKIGFLIQALLL